MKKFTIILMTIIIMVATLSAQEITGLQIIENVYNRPTGQDQEGDLTMSLINSRGDERVREIKQFLKDLFQASVMHEVEYLVIAVRRIYNERYDFETVVTFMETLYSSTRLTLPLSGILIIGY